MYVGCLYGQYTRLTVTQTIHAQLMYTQIKTWPSVYMKYTYNRKLHLLKLHIHKLNLVITYLDNVSSKVHIVCSGPHCDTINNAYQQMYTGVTAPVCIIEWCPKISPTTGRISLLLHDVKAQLRLSVNSNDIL